MSDFEIARPQGVRTSIEASTGLKRIETPDGTCRRIVTLEGALSAWMRQFAGEKRKLARINNR